MLSQVPKKEQLPVINDNSGCKESFPVINKPDVSKRFPIINDDM